MRKALGLVFLFIPFLAFCFDIHTWEIEPAEILGEWKHFEILYLQPNEDIITISAHHPPRVLGKYEFLENDTLIITDSNSTTRGFWAIELNTINITTKDGIKTFYYRTITNEIILLSSALGKRFSVLFRISSFD